MADDVKLGAIVGRNVRRFRQERGLRQDDIAAAARSFGLEWARSTVAMLETGRTDVSLATALMLPHVLARAAASESEPPTLEWLLSSDEPDEQVRLGTRCVLPALLIQKLASNEHVEFLPPQPDLYVREAERKVAAKTTQPAEDLAAAARRMWGRGLVDERDARVARLAPTGTPAELQVIRRQVTRQLKAELAATPSCDQETRRGKR